MEASISPYSSYISSSEVSTSIINTTVISHMESPISGMPSIYTTNKTPIRRRPQITHFGRNYPNTRNPIISIYRIISPVSRYPDVSILGTRRLYINR
jgi:hypothetical protein